MILNNIISSLKNAESIAVLPHISVDGDGLGSSIALALALRKLDKKVLVYIEEPVPDIFNFLPGMEIVKVYEGEACSCDVAAALDTGDLERLGKRVDIFRNAKETINIDHHQTNSEFAVYNYVNTGSSAVGEIIYQLIKTFGLNLDNDISTCLYVAISTDTGGFRYSNTTFLTHQITADLINNGVNVSEISQRVFESTSLAKVKLIGAAIGSLELFEDNRVALLTITDEMLEKVGAKEEDGDGIVNIGRNIEGVEAAVLLRQKKSGDIKINLRSKSYVDVAAIANKFGGGGHKRAAGCIMKNQLDEAKNVLLEKIKKELK